MRLQRAALRPYRIHPINAHGTHLASVQLLHAQQLDALLEVHVTYQNGLDELADLAVGEVREHRLPNYLLNPLEELGGQQLSLVHE
eukprot:6012835-Pleurochrysis_carterae.AAC.1